MTTELATVKLDGDPQHAGFHFRAAPDVEKHEKETGTNATTFVRPDGKGKPGKTRNWDKGKAGPKINLPWDAMSFVVDGNRYAVVYLDRPGNPKEARLQRARLRPLRHLLRVRVDQGQAPQGRSTGCGCRRGS